MAWGRAVVAILISILVLGGIGGASWMLANPESIAQAAANQSMPGLSTADEQALRKPYDDLAAGDFKGLLVKLESDADTATLMGQLEKMHALIPSGPYQSYRLQAWGVVVGPEQKKQLTGTLEFKYPDHSQGQARGICCVSCGDGDRPGRDLGDIARRIVLEGPEAPLALARVHHPRRIRIENEQRHGTDAI
jgi:hypothetical protein